MATAEYECRMSEVVPIEDEVDLSKFATLHKLAKKLHIGEKPDIEQFKSIMDKLMAIESDIALIKKHFNIVPIIGQ